MYCKEYRYVTGGIWGSFQADSLPGTLPETWEGVEGNTPGGKAKIAPGSELLVTGTGQVLVKNVGTGWSEL